VDGMNESDHLLLALGGQLQQELMSTNLQKPDETGS
jgi:hypothetical protein